jgi:acid stress-induced BolA-like protein IbaG/YrbA
MQSTVDENELKTCLIEDLALEDPSFELERLPSGKISGAVISPSFRGQTDTERQRRIWDVLDKHFGAESVHVVGTLLAYTPDEWQE